MSQATSYSAERSYLMFLQDSAQGGVAYTQPSPSTICATSVIERSYSQETNSVVTRQGASFNTYLRPFAAEEAASFQDRINQSCYINLCEPLISAYTSAALQKVDRNLGALEDVLAEDVDYCESSYPEFIAQCANDFAVYGFGFVVVDVDEENPNKPRYIIVDPTKVCYLQVSDVGILEAFAWVNQSEVKNSNRPTVQDLVVTLIDGNGIHTLQGTLDLGKGFDSKKLKVVSSVPLSPTLEGKLPVVVGYFKKDTTTVLPLGISLINDAAPVARMVFNLVSSAGDLLGMQVPILTFPVKKTGGAMTAEAEIAIGSKSVLPYDSDNQTPAYVAPDPASIQEIRTHADWLARWVYKLAGLDIEQSSIPQSGISLRIKSRDFENKVRAFARNLQKFETKLLTLTCTLLGLDTKGLSVAYPDRFTLPDSAENVANALAVLTLSKQVVDLGSTAKLAAAKTFLASALPLDEDQLNVILKEIERAMAVQSTPAAPAQASFESSDSNEASTQETEPSPPTTPES